jgi:hypothetical protein
MSTTHSTVLSNVALVSSPAVGSLPLSRAAAAYLHPELEFRLRYIIQEARKLADHSFRSVMKPEDIDHAVLMVSGRHIYKAASAGRNPANIAVPKLVDGKERIAENVLALYSMFLSLFFFVTNAAPERVNTHACRPIRRPHFSWWRYRLPVQICHLRSHI